MSVHKTIIDAVKTAIQGLTGEPTVVLRDRAVKLEEDALPIVILVQGREVPATQYTFGGSAFRSYEVFVYVLYAQNQNIETAIDDARPWRDAIRKRLIPDNTITPPVLTGVATVWNVDEIEAPAQRPEAAEAGYEEAKLGLLFNTCEASHA